MMEFAFWVLLILGASVALFFAVCIVVGTWMATQTAINKRHEPSWLEGRQAALNSIATDAWWFSESPETTELLRDIASGMNIAEAREKWRKARAEQGIAK